LKTSVGNLDKLKLQGVSVEMFSEKNKNENKKNNLYGTVHKGRR
jgi:hypothetical protein